MSSANINAKNNIRNSVRYALLFAAVLLSVSCRTADRNNRLPACARPDLSELIFPAESRSFDTLAHKLQTMQKSSKGNVNVWHIGGSHVQKDHFPNRMRHNFTTSFMCGDRAFLFPRALGNTNVDSTYSISTTGEWFCPRMTLPSDRTKPDYGITGFAAITTSADASVGFNLNPDGKKRYVFSSVRVLGYASSCESFPYIEKTDSIQKAVYDDATCSFVFNLDAPTDTLLIKFHLMAGDSFVLNGLQPISGRAGVNYYTSGVNGAAVTSWTNECVNFERDFNNLINPDLVIFGLGINDSAVPKEDFSIEKFKANYRRLIDMILKKNPDCALLFHTNNDSFRYVKGGMEYNRNAESVRQAMLELAAEYNAAVWDLYGVMGAENSVYQWEEAGLILPDRLHFTKDGYELVADMMFQALVKDLKNR